MSKHNGHLVIVIAKCVRYYNNYNSSITSLGTLTLPENSNEKTYWIDSKCDKEVTS